MVQLSHTLASLDQFPNCFEVVRLKAMVRVAQIKIERGEALQAFVELKTSTLALVLEHGSEKLQF